MKIKLFIIILIISIFLNLISCRRVARNAENNQNGRNDGTTEIQRHNIMKFNLADYTWELESFKCDVNIGSVENADYAITKAMDLWKEKYGEDIDGLYDYIQNQPFHVAFDEENECWHINGVLDEDLLGAVPQALIKKDGTVLAIWIG